MEMDGLKRGSCFEDSGGNRFLIMGDAVNHKDGQVVYLCQELAGEYRLMIWTAQEISGMETAAGKTDTAYIGYAGHVGHVEHAEHVEARENSEEWMQEMLLQFLEASSCSKKLELLGMMKGKATESMLESMAISMDYELGGGSVEEKYYALERFLKTRSRYEGTRLRY